MRALLKSGDTERITFFANVSRSPPIFALAAQHLMGLPWQRDRPLQRTIVDVLSKSRDFEALAAFQVRVGVISYIFFGGTALKRQSKREGSGARERMRLFGLLLVYARVAGM